MCKSKNSTNATNPSSLRTPPPPRPRRLSSSDEPPSTSTSRSAATASSAIGSSKTTASTSSAASLSSIRSSLPENFHIYDFSEIASATNNFLSKRRLPSSSSSSAWRCSLRGKEVVVFQRKPRRRLSDLRPLVSSLCKCHHSSIIKLLGASLSADHIYLVYDFVPGAPLSSALRNPNNPSFTVLHSWISRLQVAADLADGLDYIHRSSGLHARLVHNHLKSSSVIVLSDPHLHAKICHFGTAQLTGESPDNEIATELEKAPEASSSSSSGLRRSNSRVMKVQGTVGYMAPETSTDGIVSQKSDVYSFGVVMLELLSAEEPMKFRYDKTTKDLKSVSVIESARDAIESGRSRQWVDRRLKDSFPVEVAERMIRVALECVHVEPDRRPDMERVAGKVSKMLLESKKWAEKIRVPTDISVSMGPR